MTSVDSNFNFLCGRPHGAGPLPPVHMRPPEPDPSPLRVDVISRWPLKVQISEKLRVIRRVCVSVFYYSCISYVSYVPPSIEHTSVESIQRLQANNFKSNEFSFI